MLLAAPAAPACGPYFPNNLLGSGDVPLLAAPVADFRRELAALELVPGRFDYVPTPNHDFAAQTLETEIADLTTALRKAKVPDAEAILTVVAYRKQRAQFNAYVDDAEIWDRYQNSENFYPYRADNLPTNQPTPPLLAPIPGLPEEFADYFASVIAWRGLPPDTNTARQAWQQLLARPAAERKFKSTWAAFMLGKSWEDENADKAVGYFRQTRELARRGFADGTGLAVASLGWEARVELRRHHYPAALTLYLEQYAAGDDSAVESLRVAAARAVADPDASLAELAKVPRLRAVVTAYLISGGMRLDLAPVEDERPAPVAAWLAAVAAANVTDVAAAERLALAAYQSGDYELAEGWVKRARRSVVAQWVQAKLLLHKGQIPAAAAVLARLARQLPPTAASETNAPEFVDQLSLDSHSGREQLHGEWGVLALTRGDYAEALDALLRAGFWEDAAYVAERVLTIEELKNYVDQNWPTTAQTNSATAPHEVENAAEIAPEPAALASGPIRHLLARRLTRESRGREAQPYFPPEWQEALRPLLTALDAAEDAAAPAAVRAQQLFTAAWIIRTNGLELLGTELAPDWFIYAGQFESSLTWQDRATNNLDARINLATEAELERAARHRTDPDKRFHYRYQAALLGWEAAKLLPDNTDETARILCTAGSWLKTRDPNTADLFYKALVRRCRKTAIGAQADAMRWFPVLDKNGNPKPYQRPPKPEASETSTPSP